MEAERQSAWRPGDPRPGCWNCPGPTSRSTGGGDARPGAARAHGPPVRVPRAHPVRAPGLRRRCVRRSTAGSRKASSRRARCPPSPADERRDIELRSDLQYERSAPPARVPPGRSSTGSARRAGSAGEQFGPTIAETPAVPMTDEIALAETATAAPTRRLSRCSRRATTLCRSCGPSGRTRPCSSPATPRAWWTRPRPACSPTAESSCSRPTLRQAPAAPAGSGRGAPYWWSRTATAAGRAVGRDPRELRLRRAGRREATQVRPQRRPAARLPQLRSRQPDRGAAARRRFCRGDRLRQPGRYAPADRPDYAVDGDVDDRVARRRLQRRARRASSGSLDGAPGDDQFDQCRPADHLPSQPLHHQAGPHLRRPATAGSWTSTTRPARRQGRRSRSRSARSLRCSLRSWKPTSVASPATTAWRGSASPRSASRACS